MITLKLAGAILGTFLTSDVIEKSMKNYDTDIQPPTDIVSIIMPTFNEEKFIEIAASSIRNQSIINRYPEYFEFLIVDNGSTDNTITLAIPFADKVVSSPRGKLSARNYGTSISKGNIIVAVDSDVYYPIHYLNTLLKVFRDPDIVGVSGTLLDYSFPNFPPTLFIILSPIWRMANPLQMLGGNCAYYKHIFYQMGQFNEHIDQFNAEQVIKEEEFDFGERLSKFGKVTYKMNASCIHLGGFRTACRMGLTNSSECIKYKFGKDRF